MPTAEKTRTIEQAKEWYSSSRGVVFTDYRGLKVKEMQKLRSDIRKKGGELHVLKNTLFRIAAGEDTAQMPDEFHNGTTAIAFVFENESECAKAIFDYAKTNKALKVKGGFFSGKPFSAKQVEALSELPPRDVLLAQVIGTVVAPITQLVGVIEQLYADPIRVIGAVADKVAESSPKPAPAPEPVAVVEEAAPVAATEEPTPEAGAGEAAEVSTEATPEPAEEAPAVAEEAPTTNEEEISPEATPE